jgi:hypothetical protein
MNIINSLMGLINKAFDNLEKILFPIVFLLLVEMIVFVIGCLNKKDSEKCFDETTYIKKYGIPNLIACIFAAISMVLSYFADSSHILIGWVYIIVIFIFSIYLIYKQNEDNSGYIDSLENASAVLLYISTIVIPFAYAILYLILIVFLSILYKITDNDELIKMKKNRFVDLLEALVASGIMFFIPYKDFGLIGYLWFNTIIVIVFSILIPVINKKLYIDDNLYS